MSEPSLRELQQSFWALISAPTGVRDAATAQPRHAALLSSVVSSPEASALSRLDLYANMYFYRLHDSLQQDFPKLAAVLGEVPFHNLVTDYLWACPSQQPSARYVGARLPAFLRSHALAGERPWLGELACLEWARVDVADRRDQPLLSLAALQAHAARGFGELKLRLVSAQQLLPSAYAVEETWRALSAPAAVATQILVWRAADLTVLQRSLSPLECQIWHGLQTGLSFVELCGALLESLPAEAAAKQAVAWLDDWARSGLLVG